MRILWTALLALAALISPASAQSAANDPAIGAYRFAGGREAYVEYVEEIGGLAMIEFPTGRVRPLTPNGPGAFSFGPTMGAREPIVAQLQSRDGRLRWIEEGRTRTGRRLQFDTEEVRIRSGDLSLAGTLTLPLGRGPFPAVVLLHGGGAQTREFIWVEHFFARRGVAVLAYDKRGVGGSSGDWQTASVHDLASDALAAVAFLRARADIRRERIGLYGSSAGGWVAPTAAARAPEQIAFVIARSASALPARFNVIYEVEGDLRNAGYGDDVVARARALHEQDVAVVAANGEGWEALRQALRVARAEPWFDLARLPGELIEDTPANSQHIDDFIAAERRDHIDPPALWSEVRVPVLIQIGGRDRYVPGPESAERLRDALAANPRAEVKLYPNGDHPMFDSVSGYARDIPGVSHFANGYLTDLDAFVRSVAR